MPFPYLLSGGLLIIIRWAAAWRRGERPIHRVPIGDLESPQWAQVGSDLKVVLAKLSSDTNQTYLLTSIKMMFWHEPGQNMGCLRWSSVQRQDSSPRWKHNKLNLSSSSSQLFVFKMCTYAQEWADQMLAENRFQHRWAPPFFWESYS